jgi:hypothetical protein
MIECPEEFLREDIGHCFFEFIGDILLEILRKHTRILYFFIDLTFYCGLDSRE